MQNKEPAKIHFALLIIATVWYLYNYRGTVWINNGTPEISPLDMAAFCRNTMLYLAFSVVVFAHALLWRSSSGQSQLSEEDRRTLDRMRSRAAEEQQHEK